MLNESPQLERIDPDFWGRLIAYGGGGTVGAASSVASAMESATVADWALWMSALAVLGRLIFDVVKYIADRRTKP